jgi:hypothetical protein
MANQRLFRDGKVAMLITQSYSEFPPTDRFCRETIDSILATTYTGPYIIEWITIGEKFVIGEYDGYEAIQYESDIDWQVL